MRKVVTVVLVAQLLGGCSFALVSGPPANHRKLAKVECTTSRAGPGLDKLWTIPLVANLALAALSSEQEWNDRFGGGKALPLYASLAVAGVASMVYGYTIIGDCRRAKAEAEERAIAHAREVARGGTGEDPDRR